MGDSKISIIVPVYNAAAFLDACITSLMKQSYRNLEILLVNDGSTDDSLELCKAYASRDSRIIVVDKENEGPGSARNVGLEIATGDFIGFVDSDDYVSLEMYEKLILAIMDADADIAECGYFITPLDHRAIEKRSLKSEVLVGEDECTRKFLATVNTTHHCWNKLYRSSIVGHVRFALFKYSEDYVFNAKAFSYCRKKVTIAECCYYYVTNPDSIVRQPFNMFKLNTIRAGKEVMEFHKGSPELCKYPIVYILINIRNLYKEVTDTDYLSLRDKKEVRGTLISEYRFYFPLAEKDLGKTVRNKQTSASLRLFYYSPLLYYLVQKLRESLGYS